MSYSIVYPSINYEDEQFDKLEYAVDHYPCDNISYIENTKTGKKLYEWNSAREEWIPCKKPRQKPSYHFSKIKTPKLIPIDLSLGSEHNHTAIKVGSKYQYLAKIGGQYHTGNFSRQWYGLNFESVYDAGLQYDKPGTNNSDWEALWLI